MMGGNSNQMMMGDPMQSMKKVPNLTNYKIVKCKNFEKGKINLTFRRNL